MKKIFTRPFLLLAAASLAFTACSDDDENSAPKNTCPKTHTETIRFEPSELIDLNTGEQVAPGDLTLNLYGVPTPQTFHNVFCGKAYATAELPYAGPLFNTNDNNIFFNTTFDATYDSWSGFVLTKNYAMTGAASNLSQFMVSASDSGYCLLGFDGYYYGASEYARPTIDFDNACTVCHLRMANSLWTYAYAPTTVSAAEFYYKVKVTGSLNSTTTGTVECALINGANKVSDWQLFDISALGKVDKLVFEVVSNEANTYGLLAPAYFAIDEIGFIAAK